jgi:hypothetical protein
MEKETGKNVDITSEDQLPLNLKFNVMVQKKYILGMIIGQHISFHITTLI